MYSFPFGTITFSTTILATDNPDEALASSLNKYGKVDLDYSDAFGNRATLCKGEIAQANLRVLDVSALQFTEI